MARVRSLSAACIAAAGLVAASCSSEPTSPPVARRAAAIVRGIDSDAAQDATVLVMHYDALAKGGGAASGCTGSLLAPRLVLTARHCVAITEPTAACDSKGRPIAGGAVERDHDPSAIYVFAGKDRPNFIAGTARPARGKEILSTGASTLCDNDIALVVLDRDLEGGKLTPVRLDTKPAKGELVTVVGWGIADDDPNPQTRRQRANVEILDVGPAEALGPKEFRIGEGTCQGDSGGPAIAASGAVLGALSRGGNGLGGGGAEGCLGGTNIFSSTAGHAALIRDGYARVGQEPWLEGQPSPLLARTGEACAADADCRTGLCDAERKTCADDCSQSPCAEGGECVAQSERRLCVPKPSAEGDASGCAAAAACPRPVGGLAVVAAAVVLLRVRRWPGRGKRSEDRGEASL